MKTLIIFIAIFLLVLLVLNILNKKTTIAPTNEEIKQTEQAEQINIENGQYKIDTEKSIINWSANKKIITNWIDRGIIKIKSGSLTLNDSGVTDANFVIDMNSISANTTGSGQGQDKLTNHLKSADFFDVENFSESKFQIKSISPTDTNNQYDVIGDLTIKGKTNEIKFIAKISKENNTYKITGDTILDRTLWDIRYGSDKFFDNLGNNVISDEVNLEIVIFANKNNE